MVKKFVLMLAVLFTLFTLTNCGGIGSTVSSICNRLDECNALNTSVKECIEINQKNIENMTSTQQEDALRALNECLKLKACNNFVACLQ